MAVIHGLWTEPDGWTLRRPALACWRLDAAWRYRAGRPPAPAHPVRRQGRTAARRPRRALRRRVQPELRLAGRRSGGLRPGPCRLRRDRSRSRRGDLLGDDRRAHCRVRAKTCESASPPSSASSARRVPTATRGSPSDADAGSWGPRTRPTSGCGRSRRAGVQRVMLQDFVPRDLDHVRLMGRVFGG